MKQTGKDERPLGIVVVCDGSFGFPNGYAATRYVRLLARGLSAAGACVRVAIAKYSEEREHALNREGRGTFEGVKFEYATGSPVWPETRWKCRIGKVRGRFSLAARLLLLRVQHQLTAVVLYGRDPELLRFLGCLCGILRRPLVVYVVEWTLSRPARSEGAIQDDRSFYRDLAGNATATVAISRYIRDRLAAAHPQRQLPCLVTSILCDPDEWHAVRAWGHERPYLLYCADLVGYRADTLYVLSAFCKARLPSLDLMLVGPATPDFLSELRVEAEAMGVSDRVQVITAHLSDRALQELIKGAEALLAPLHDDSRSMARFPSKLGEYLMSGRPVVTSEVGEVSRYLKDGVHAFVAGPGSAAVFAVKITEAVNDPNRAAVAKNGRGLASKEFSHVRRAAELLDFIRATCFVESTSLGSKMGRRSD